MIRGMGSRKNRERAATWSVSPTRKVRHVPAKRQVAVTNAAVARINTMRANTPFGAVGRSERVTVVAGTMDA